MDTVHVTVPHIEFKRSLLTRIVSIILGLIIAVVLIYMGFRVVQTTILRAEDIAPRDVVVSQITDRSALITWTTGRETQSVLEYGVSPTSMNFFSPETERTASHSVKLTLLSPKTTYYFEIRTGEQKWDNGGVPWMFTTLETGSGAPKKNVPSPTLPIQPSTPTIVPTITGDICSGTNCELIKSKMGSECTAQDYSRCLQKTAEPTPTLAIASKAEPTPTLMTAPKLTITSAP